MKLTLLLLLIIFHVSCSTAEKKQKLTERIQAEEYRSFHEIEKHSNILLEEHTELDAETKNELRDLLKLTMSQHKDLREEESKIIQLLVQKSLATESSQRDGLKELKSRLQNVYKKKSEVILNLIKTIVSLSERNKINQGFRDDIMTLIREFR